MRPITPPPLIHNNENAGFLGNHGGAVALAMAGIVMSLMVYVGVSNFHQREVRQIFENEVHHLTNEVTQRFEQVEQELYSLRGMVGIKPNVDLKEFRHYINTFHSQTITHSVRGYAILQPLTRDKIDAFVETQRETYGEYRFHQIHPDNENIVYPVKYIEPLAANVSALGLDIGSEPLRRAALEHAVAAAEPTLTPQITLVQDQKKTPGFLMFMPVYDRDVSNASVEERKQSLVAIVDAAIISEELLAGVAESTDNLLDFELFGGKNAPNGRELIYDADGHIASKHLSADLRKRDFGARGQLSVQHLRIGGRDFILSITSKPEFDSRHRTYTPLLLSFIVALITAGLVMALYNHARARLRAESMARAMTQDLERLAVVARSTTNGVVFASRDKRVTWINEGFENITGYTLEDCLGKTPIELMVCDKTDLHELNRLRKTLENGQIYKGEVLTRRKNGDTYWALLQVQPLYGRDGSLTGYMGFETDIHDRKLAEEALRKNRDQFASLVSNIPGVTYRCKNDNEWEMIYLSAQMDALTGYPAGDFIGNAVRTFASIVHPDDLAQLQREIDAAIDRRESWDVEYRLLRANGATCWVRERGSAVFEQEELVYLDGFILDITYQKQAFVQLARQQQILEGMSQLGRIGAWELDAINKKLFWSSMTKQIHEVSPNTEPDLASAILFYKEGASREQIKRALEEALEFGTPWYLELQLITAKGRELWVAANGQAEFKDGRCVRLFGSFQDIDQRKQHDIQQQATADLNRSLASLHVHPEILNGELHSAASLFIRKICTTLGVTRASLWKFSDDQKSLISEAEFDEKTQGIVTGSVIRCDEFPSYFHHLREQVHIAADDVDHHPATSELAVVLKPMGISSVLHVAITTGTGLTGLICAEHTGISRAWAPNEISFMMSLGTLAGNLISSAQKRQALQALEISEARLRGLFDLSPLGIALNDFESGRFLEINDAIAKPSGYTKEEFANLSYWDLTPREYEAEEARMLEQLTQNGAYGPYEKQYIRKDGSRYSVLLNGMLIQDSAGKKLIWSFVEDISERKANENALKQLWLQLEKFFELSVNFMCIATLDGQFTKVNHTFTQVLDYSEEELTKTNFLNFVHPEDVAATENEMTQLRKGVTTVAFRNRYRKRDGTFITLQWYSVADTETRKIYASAVDITAQQDTMEALIRAKEAAESAARLKGEFLATMSHEIRTPLNGVMGMLGLLERSPLNDEQHQRVSVANSSAKSLLGIINDILDFSKVDAGKMAIENIQFDLVRLLEETIAPMRYRAEDRGVKLTLDLEGVQTRFVTGDPTRLRQVVSNLLGNAIKFTHHGSIQVVCGQRRGADGDLLFTARVSDTGIGIPANKLDTLFEPFTQADASTTRKYGGTGLGLAICRKLCQLMGGDIGVSSVVGEGSCFEFHIVMKAADGQALGETNNTGMIPSLSLPTLGDENSSVSLAKITQPIPQWPPHTRLLAVEDNPVNQDVLLSLLRELNLQADIACNGIEAISMLRGADRDAPYSLILMDCLMPEMDGFEATRYIRAGRGGAHNKDIPIIAVTANALQGDRERCEQAGMSDYVTKPLSPQRLAYALATWLRCEIIPAAEEFNSLSEQDHFTKKSGMQNENNPPLWDYEGVVASLGGRREIVKKLLGLFVEKLPGQLETLQQSMQGEDLATVERLAHSIKGSAAQFKATVLTEHAAKLEAAAHAGNWEAIRSAHAELEHACTALNDELRTFLSSPAT